MIQLRTPLLILLASSPALCADIVVYRCTGTTGVISLQDVPCAAGEREERRRLSAPVDRAPATNQVFAPSSPQPTHDTVRSSSDATPRRAPPPLFECERYDGERYESADGIPQRHWVPLWALDADPRTTGSTLDPATIGRTSPLRRTARDGVPALSVSAATLGTWVEDSCRLLSPAQICARRRDALADYGRRIFNAGQSEADRLRAEEASLRAQIREECTE